MAASIAYGRLHNYVTFMSRTVCRACWAKVTRGEMAADDEQRHIVSAAELKAWQETHRVAMVGTAEGRRLIGRRTAAHYAKFHPEIKLPEARGR